jgi:hypothetical protein
MLTSKTHRVHQEFLTLKTKNWPLAAIMLDLADFVHDSFQKDVVMTMIFRTQEEQWELYKKTDGPKTKRKSPHMSWLAVDIRDRIYTSAERDQIFEFLKAHYDRTNKLNPLPSGSRTAWRHAIKGQAFHFHIQYKGPTVYVFNQGLVIRPERIQVPANP